MPEIFQMSAFFVQLDCVSTVKCCFSVSDKKCLLYREFVIAWKNLERKHSSSSFSVFPVTEDWSTLRIFLLAFAIWIYTTALLLAIVPKEKPPGPKYSVQADSANFQASPLLLGLRNYSKEIEVIWWLTILQKWDLRLDRRNHWRDGFLYLNSNFQLA